MKETRVCEKHGEYMCDAINVYGKTLLTGCPGCFAEDDAKERAEQAKRDEARLKACNIEQEFYGATLDNFVATTASQKKALEACKNLTETKRGKIILLGSNGLGKTHLGSAVVKRLGGAIYTMYEITTRIRMSYSSRAKESELDIVDELARLPMLVIDELGRTNGSDAETNWLSYIIDKRHVRSLPLMLLSNNHLAKDCTSGGCNKCLERYLDNDAVSRLSNGEIIMLTGSDYRRRR